MRRASIRLSPLLFSMCALALASQSASAQVDTKNTSVGSSTTETVGANLPTDCGSSELANPWSRTKWPIYFDAFRAKINEYKAPHTDFAAVGFDKWKASGIAKASIKSDLITLPCGGWYELSYTVEVAIPTNASSKHGYRYAAFLINPADDPTKPYVLAEQKVNTPTGDMTATQIISGSTITWFAGPTDLRFVIKGEKRDMEMIFERIEMTGKWLSNSPKPN